MGLPESCRPTGSRSRVPDRRAHCAGPDVSKMIAQRLAQATPLRATAFIDPLPAAEPACLVNSRGRNDVFRRTMWRRRAALFGPAFVMSLFSFHVAQASELAQALAVPVMSTDWRRKSGCIAHRACGQARQFTWSMAASRWLERKIADPAIVHYRILRGHPGSAESSAQSCLGANGFH